VGEPTRGSATRWPRRPRTADPPGARPPPPVARSARPAAATFTDSGATQTNGPTKPTSTHPWRRYPAVRR
jgi:hypothetical protein